MAVSTCGVLSAASAFKDGWRVLHGSVCSGLHLLDGGDRARRLALDLGVGVRGWGRVRGVPQRIGPRLLAGVMYGLRVAFSEVCGDLTGDANTDSADIAVLLSAWGTCG